MALVVEDGTGKADAESYASVAAFLTYFANRGVDVSAITNPGGIEHMLRNATDFMEGEFRLAWKGTRNSVTQALSWPRYGVTITDAPGGYGTYPYTVPNNVVPNEVVNACIILAWKAYNADDNDLAPDIDRVALREAVDVIEIEYDPNSSPSKQYRSIGNMLAMYLGGNGSAAMASLVRC